MSHIKTLLNGLVKWGAQFAEKRQAEVFALGAGGNGEPLKVVEEKTDLVREVFLGRCS